MPRTGKLSLIHYVRTQGPYEDWIGYLEADGRPEEPVLARVPDQNNSDQALLQQGLRHATDIAKLVEHPNVVYYFGTLFGNNDDIAQLSELVDGLSLDDLVSAAEAKEQGLALDLIVWIGRQIAEGLAHAHSLGVAHPFLCADRILASREGVIKIDFGVPPFQDPQQPLAANTERTETDRSLSGIEPPVRDTIRLTGILNAMLAPHLRGEQSQEAPSNNLAPAVPESLLRLLKELNEAPHKHPLSDITAKLTRCFYADLDGDDERGAEALVLWVNRCRHREPGTSKTISVELTSSSKSISGQFSQLLEQRAQPVRPESLTSGDAPRFLGPNPERAAPTVASSSHPALSLGSAKLKQVSESIPLARPSPIRWFLLGFTITFGLTIWIQNFF